MRINQWGTNSLLIQVKPPADVTNFERLHTCVLQAQAQFKIWTQLRRGVIYK